MKFFDKWFYRKARWCWHRAGIAYPELKAEQDYLDESSNSHRNDNSISLERESVGCVSNEIDLGLASPIRFKVAGAEGGMIVEVSTYDQKNDRTITKHHIISDDVEDKSVAIARIVSWEFLRRVR